MVINKSRLSLGRVAIGKEVSVSSWFYINRCYNRLYHKDKYFLPIANTQ